MKNVIEYLKNNKDITGIEVKEYAEGLIEKGEIRQLFINNYKNKLTAYKKINKKNIEIDIYLDIYFNKDKTIDKIIKTVVRNKIQKIFTRQ